MPTHSPLKPEHLSNARLFATRDDMACHLSEGYQGGLVAEVGVALGGFSQLLIDAWRPSVFNAIDRFDQHTIPFLWGTPSEEIFNGKTHEEYYRDVIKTANIIKSDSVEGLKTLEDNSHDLIYIDAGHTYDDVKADADVAVSKAKESGILIFNDYIMFDHFIGQPYGVVQVVNDLVVSSDWRIVGFSLQQEMFCDIALRRA